MAVQCYGGSAITVLERRSKAEDCTQDPWARLGWLGFGACHERAMMSHGWRDVSGWMEKGSFVTERRKENCVCLD